MKKKVFTLLFALVAIATTAQAQVVLNETNFPDANFRKVLAKKFGISEGDEITEAKIAATTALSIHTGTITDLTGIEHFTALTYLNCSYNKLTSLDVSKNTALTYLDCYRSQLTTLDVSKNTALTELECSWNQLTSLDVSNNTALAKLFCYGNQLTSLDVSKNTALTKLDCGSNQLTSLDVSKNTALTKLKCDGNQLTSLNVSQNTALEVLYCYQNQLASLDVSKNTALTYLLCYNNQLTSLDVSKNTALTYLNCSSNQLTTLDVSKNTALNELVCRNNQLTSIDVSKNAALKKLSCFINLIKGEAMDVLVASLPTVEWGYLYIFDTKDENEGNVCTKAQVAIAKEKGWTVYDARNFQEYEGSDPSAVEAIEANSEKQNAHWYSIGGVKLSGEPTKKGIYIYKGKKVKK